jgi:LacI family transcriptional regulator
MINQQENTIKDIAQVLGLSPSTVSRALKDHPHINAETKIKVKEAALKLGYQYNAMAASLRNNRSNTIGLIIPRISRYYQSAVITAIQNKLHEYKYNVMICQSNESIELEKELVNALYASRVEGLIVSATLHTEDFSHFDVFSNSNRPLVFFDRVPKTYASHKIHGNDFEGGYLATTHLLEKGCRQIAIIAGPLSCNLYNDRYEGYKAAMKKYKVPLNKEMMFFHDLTRENASKSSETLFSKTEVPDGVFACNDTSALAVVLKAKEFGISIPVQLKVIGYANDPLSEIIDPSITSIEQHPYEVGEQAALMMMNLLQEKNKGAKRYRNIDISINLIPRKSTENSVEVPVIPIKGSKATKRARKKVI